MVWIYDLETYPNFFCAGFEEYKTGEKKIFEISDWKNQGDKLKEFINSQKWFLVGYNNNSFDDPILNYILRNKTVTAKELYDIAQMIIIEQRKKPHEKVYKDFKKIILF